jgi:hypothetical protein
MGGKPQTSTAAHRKEASLSWLTRAKPELLYPETEDLKLTRPTGSGNLRETY